MFLFTVDPYGLKPPPTRTYPFDILGTRPQAPKTVFAWQPSRRSLIVAGAIAFGRFLC